MTRPIASLLLAVLVASQTSCALLRQRRARWQQPSAADLELAAHSRRPLQRVGVVTLVDPAQGFVLIDSGSLPSPAEGARLRTYTASVSSGEVQVSAVRRRPFVVADILQGTPRAGDEVFEAAPAALVPTRP
jgi:hypothetical protein